MQLLLLIKEKSAVDGHILFYCDVKVMRHFHVNYEEYRKHPDWFEEEYLMPIPAYDELLSLLSRNSVILI